jgi:hypothetical protein
MSNSEIKNKSYIFLSDSYDIDNINLDNENDNNLIHTLTVNLPLISLGFQTYLHRTQLSFLNILNNKKLPDADKNSDNMFYYIINPFENIISNYNDNLDNLSKLYFNIQDDIVNINSKSFYKLWEILFIFNIANNELNCAIISDNSLPIVQAIVNYRKKFNFYNINDKIFNIDINSKNLEIDQEIIQEKKGQMDNKKILNFYNNMYKLLSIEKNNKYTKKSNIININKTGKDIKKNLDKFTKDNDTKINLIISDSNTLWKNPIFKEQEFYVNFIQNIINSLKILNINGNFILKIYETFTFVSIKLIYILSCCFDKIYFYKPYFSRQSDSDKYLILKNFKFDQNKDKKILNNLILSLQNIIDNYDNSKYIFDIFPNLNIPINLNDKIKNINIKIANQQQICINEIIKFINEDNYYGDKYHKYKEIQIESTKWWVSIFYPPSNNLMIKNKEFFEQDFQI